MTLEALIAEWRGLDGLFVVERDGVETEYVGILDGPYVRDSPGVGFVLGERLVSGDIAVGGAYVDISAGEARSASRFGAGYVELNVRGMPTEIEKHSKEALWTLDLVDGSSLKCLLAVTSEWEHPDYFRNPSDERVAEVSRAWLRYESKDREKPDPDDPDWWAIELVMGLHGHIETEWRLVLSLCSLADNEKAVEMIGVGPIEGLLSNYGEQAMDVIETEKPPSPTLRRALASVWAFSSPGRPRLETYLVGLGVEPAGGVGASTPPRPPSPG
jgi:hypothetical protein